MWFTGKVSVLQIFLGCSACPYENGTRHHPSIPEDNPARLGRIGEGALERETATRASRQRERLGATHRVSHGSDVRRLRASSPKRRTVACRDSLRAFTRKRAGEGLAAMCGGLRRLCARCTQLNGRQGPTAHREGPGPYVRYQGRDCPIGMCAAAIEFSLRMC